MLADLGFTVFVMGDDPAARNSNSQYGSRERYLERTLQSMTRYCKQVVVYVCNDHDAGIASKYLTGPGMSCTQLEVADTMMLALEACKHIQNHAHVPDDAIVYYTEADQVLVALQDRKELADVLRKNSVYVSMHRLEELYGACGSDRGPCVQSGGRHFVMPNTTDDIPAQASFSDRFYVSPSTYEAFAGAFLISMGNMRRVTFQVTDGLRVESACFSCFSAMPCLKTKRVLDVFVHHLSGYEYHQQLAGVTDVKPSP